MIGGAAVVSLLVLFSAQSRVSATSIAPGDTYDSSDGVKFSSVGTFDDYSGTPRLSSKPLTDRHTTAFKQYGAAVQNSNKMLDTCYQYCQEPSQYNPDSPPGSAGEFGAAPYFFFAVQSGDWCSCTDKLDKSIPSSNPTEHKWTSELLWGAWGVGGVYSIWMKTYEGGCPAPYNEIVRTGGPYVGNPPAEPLQRLDAADCVAACHAKGKCVGIETNGEFCKLLTSTIDEGAEQAARPKANFVLCKKPSGVTFLPSDFDVEQSSTVNDMTADLPLRYVEGGSRTLPAECMSTIWDVSTPGWWYVKFTDGAAKYVSSITVYGGVRA
eukprot:g10696.t1